jgi:hypothetical protein
MPVLTEIPFISVFKQFSVDGGVNAALAIGLRDVKTPDWEIDSIPIKTLLWNLFPFPAPCGARMGTEN